MKKLWEKWERHYGEEDTKQICKDGIVQEDILSFHNQKIRILFLGKECNDWPGGDIRELSRRGPKYSYFYNIARWSTGILEGFPIFEKIDNWGTLHNNLQKVALINLKKMSGGATADMTKISAYAKNDKTLLREQVELIDPNIIVTLGTHDIALWLFDLEVEPNSPNVVPYFSKKNKLWVIPFIHPSFRGKKKSRYELLRNFMQKSDELIEFINSNR